VRKYEHADRSHEECDGRQREDIVGDVPDKPCQRYVEHNAERARGRTKSASVECTSCIALQ
jgi:hypothetical protein